MTSMLTLLTLIPLIGAVITSVAPPPPAGSRHGTPAPRPPRHRPRVHPPTTVAEPRQASVEEEGHDHAKHQRERRLLEPIEQRRADPLLAGPVAPGLPIAEAGVDRQE